jgi:small subunit ribosomal protein S16
MAVKIRLARMGAKKKPFYRVVVADAQAKRDGRFIEILGTYDPNQDPAEFKIKQDRLAEWLQKGAQPTDTVASLIKGLSDAPAAT